ncbi:hypothetical protein BDK51DRAFT_48410 [Blyttiomyces helicus]|uniref:SLC41A/MgtE integral membrane domain-containing protein n=1 Tax=Blyttiomyces helicus TaxID=388810 RepID=A0A4P9WKJ7_9FUNG|nr:hypothetical protein BDK51DRAFT_48410 [Blyttiomyces helicus]|eukprot:RKO92922.1 hypothetical protein BDK51DRAFT_48410 [Blyttiomyces helicus]
MQHLAPSTGSAAPDQRAQLPLPSATPAPLQLHPSQHPTLPRSPGTPSSPHLVPIPLTPTPITSTDLDTDLELAFGDAPTPTPPRRYPPPPQHPPSDAPPRSASVFTPLRFDVDADIDDDDDETEFSPGGTKMSVVSLLRKPRGAAAAATILLDGVGRLPEDKFLSLLLHQSSFDDAQDLARARLDYLVANDDAATMEKTPFYKIAFWRCPAIIATLLFGLCVGGIIASYNSLVTKHILLSSFIPIISSVSGNIGLQASTTTLRALATGHASSADLNGALRVVAKEFMSAVVIASAASCTLGTIAYFWSSSARFAFVSGVR